MVNSYAYIYEHNVDVSQSYLERVVHELLPFKVSWWGRRSRHISYLVPHQRSPSKNLNGYSS